MRLDLAEFKSEIEDFFSSDTLREIDYGVLSRKSY